MLMYPKKKYSKMQKTHAHTSVLQHDDVCCYVTGSTINLHKHHIYFGRGMRDISEKYGFYVYLTVDLHEGTNGVHGKNGHDLDMQLKIECQRAFEEQGHSRAEFMAIIGKNYIDDVTEPAEQEPAQQEPEEENNGFWLLENTTDESELMLEQMTLFDDVTEETQQEPEKQQCQTNESKMAVVSIAKWVNGCDYGGFVFVGGT